MSDVFLQLMDTLEARKGADPNESYVASLHDQGINKILEKVGEETTEVILAAKDCGPTSGQDEVVNEVADLWFHCMVLLSHLGLSIADIEACLHDRFDMSGLAEKAARNPAK